MKNKIFICKSCEVVLSKNIIALNRKLFPLESKKRSYFCLTCMANYLECEERELLDKIEQFKSEGCKLFQ